MTTYQARLGQALAELLEIEPEQVSLDTPLGEMGLDSLLSLRLARTVEELTGAEADLEWIFDYPTLRALSAFLEQRFGPARVSALAVSI